VEKEANLEASLEEGVETRPKANLEAKVEENLQANLETHLEIKLEENVVCGMETGKICIFFSEIMPRGFLRPKRPNFAFHIE
jgi:hypothetical protein